MFAGLNWTIRMQKVTACCKSHSLVIILYLTLNIYDSSPRDLPSSGRVSSSQASYAKENFAVYRLEAKLPNLYSGKPTKRQVILDAADHIETQQNTILELNGKLAAREDQVRKMASIVVRNGEDKKKLDDELKRAYTRLDGVKNALVTHKDDKDFDKLYKSIESIMMCGKNTSKDDKKDAKENDNKSDSSKE